MILYVLSIEATLATSEIITFFFCERQLPLDIKGLVGHKALVVGLAAGKGLNCSLIK